MEHHAQDTLWKDTAFAQVRYPTTRLTSAMQVNSDFSVSRRGGVVRRLLTLGARLQRKPAK